MNRAKVLGNFLLLAVAVIFSLALGELTFRAVDGYRLDRLELETRQKQATDSISPTLSYAKRLRFDRDFNLAWFQTNPPDYDRSNTYRLPRDWVKAVADYRLAPGERGFIKDELKFLYNYNWLMEVCRTGKGTNVIRHYREYPGFVYAFRPTDDSAAPQYRLVPRGWNEGLDSYNNFGFRGPDITPRKSARTIRLAFLGGSTTVQGWPFTYPEYVAHYLQMWANAAHLDVRFDVINAGRSGLDSTGIAKIMRYEVAPLHPDIVVYDGALNDFTPAAYAITDGRSPPVLDKTNVRASLKIKYLPLEQYSALLDRFYELMLRRGPANAEAPKPAHTLTFDFSGRPNIDQANLPFRLNGQIVDVRAIESATRSIGAQLFLASSLAIVKPGLQLDAERDRLIIGELNTEFWPLTYAEIRQALDFQNELYRKLADHDRVAFLDTAHYFPEDPSLFSDVFHFRSQDGERLQGWIVAQMLAPYVETAIQRHRLPAGTFEPESSALAWVSASPIKFRLDCLAK